jgi:hypothetical protein
MVTSERERESESDRRILWYPYKDTATANYLFSHRTDSFGDEIKNQLL